MTADHPDIEALSACIDGEAPEWAAHVVACRACQATVDELRAVAAAVAAPVEGPTAAVREHAIAVALGGVVDLHRADRGPRPSTARRTTQARWMFPAVAALVLVVVGFSALMAMSGRSSTDRTTLADPALESAPTADSFVASSPTPLTDLGDVPDAATLLARARPALTAKDASAAGPSSAGPSSAAPSSAGQRVAAPAPATPGTRPCEEQARARQPSLGPVVYFATARRQGVPAVVLGFSAGPSPAPVTLLLLAQDGCGELLRVAGP